MCFICLRFCLLYSKIESVKHCEKSSIMTIYSSRNLWLACSTVRYSQIKSANTKISECLGFNLKTDSHSWKPNNQSTSFLWPKSPLTSGHITSQISIPLIIMCGEQLSKRPIKHQTLNEGKDNRNIYKFKQRDCQKGMQEILKSFKGHDWG